MSDWNSLESVQSLEDLINNSYLRPQLIFKHSTRCGISSQAQDRLLEKETELASAFDLYYLDLLACRPVSDSVMEILNVVHQSPQVIIVNRGKAVLSLSHQSVSPEKILAKALIGN